MDKLLKEGRPTLPNWNEVVEYGPKPSYVFVGGVSHTPDFFEELRRELAVSGYTSSAVAYPTCSYFSPYVENTKQWDEVTAIREEVCHHLDGMNKDVVLVLHDYGGWPGSRAVKGLDKEARVKQGKSTGIIEVVFVAAFIVPDHAATAEFSHLPYWLKVERGCRKPNEDSIPLLFSDMEESQQKRWLAKFQWHRNDFTAMNMLDTPWPLTVPKTYILTTDDKLMAVQFQFQMLQRVIDNTWSIKSIKTGHEPFLTHTAYFAKVLVRPSNY